MGSTAEIGDWQNVEYTAEEVFCERREDAIHCDCWWDGEPCCACGRGGATPAELSPEDGA